MGGKAIAGCQRMTPTEYKDICRVLLAHDPTILITRSFTEKESYGNVDVIALKPLDLPNVLETRKNGHVTSIGWNNHQIDVFLTDSRTKQEHLQTYLSYGLFGMCVGICLKIHGLEYGLDGLKTSGNPSILLSNSSDDIFHFLRLDYNRFRAGFANANELFDFLLGSPYMSYDVLIKKAEKQERLAPLLAYTPISALTFFGKQKEYDELVAAHLEKERLAEISLGRIVMDVISWPEGANNSCLNYYRLLCFSVVFIFIKRI
jgi:hypothetical protein